MGYIFPLQNNKNSHKHYVVKCVASFMVCKLTRAQSYGFLSVGPPKKKDYAADIPDEEALRALFTCLWAEKK